MGRGRQHKLTEKERENVVRFLLLRVRNDKLAHGSIDAAARHFKLYRNIVGEFWKRRDDASSRKKGRVRRKKKYSVKAIEQKMEDVGKAQRQTVRSTAASVGVSATMFWRMMKAGHFRRTATRIRPLLTSVHMVKRRNFAMDFVSPELPLRFHDFYDYVHIDEKWFFIDLDWKCFYLTKNDTSPQRAYRSKRHLLKIMLLVAVTRPRYDHKHNQWFYGKIGLWPFATERPAIRNSKLRPKGTLVTVTVNVDRDQVRKKLIQDVIPAIKAAWPGSKRVRIQQDNASPHCVVDDPLIVAACEEGGWNMKLVSQPAQSPNFNVPDLGLFSAMQALQQTKQMCTIPDIISAVKDAYSELKREALDNCFLTLMSVIEQCLAAEGGNSFFIPHIKKQQRRAQRENLRTLECSESAYQAAWISRYLK